MDTKYSNVKVDLFNLLVTTLLVTQVILSVFIAFKLTNIEKSGLVQSKVGYQPPNYIQQVSADDDPMIGDRNSIVTIVEFGDYQCPFCQESHKNVKKIIEEYKGKISFVFRDFPLNSHPLAFDLAIAANCANEQGVFWEAHDLLYEKQSEIKDRDSIIRILQTLPLNLDKFKSCLLQQKYKEEVWEDLEDGKEYQINGVPTFFINGHRVIGGTYEQIKSEIDKELK